MSSWRKRGSASNPKMEYQVFSCIFHLSLAMATLGLKEIGKFLWEGREKGGKSRKKGRANEELKLLRLNDLNIKLISLEAEYEDEENYSEELQNLRTLMLDNTNVYKINFMFRSL